MKLDPDTILTKTFSHKAFGGYNTSEVADFLKKLAVDIEEYNQQNQDLSNKLKEKESFIREYRDREGMLKNTITTAQNMAEKIKKDAEKEAQFILEDARQKADIVVQSAKDSLKKTYQDVSDLKRLHIQLRNTLKSVLQSHQDLLNQQDSATALDEGLKPAEDMNKLAEQKMAQSLNQAMQAKDYL